jgi:O-antigen/teichoic acid export membrane protein
LNHHEIPNGDEVVPPESTGQERRPLRRRFIGGAKWLLVGSAAGRALSLAGTILVARLLLPREFGQLTYVQAAVTFVAGFALLGLNVAVTKSVAAVRAASPSQAVGLIRLSLNIAVVSGTLFALAVFLLRAEVARLLGSPELADQLAQGSLAVAAGATIAVAIGALNGLESFRSVAIVTSLRSVLASALMVSGAMLLGVAGAITGWAVGECVAATVAVFSVVRRSRALGAWRSYGRSAATWRYLRAIGFPAFAANVAVTLALVLGQRILAQQPSGYQHIAQFNIAYRWSLAVLFIPASIGPILLPLLANLRAEGAVAAFVRVLRTNLWLNVGLTALPAAVLIVFRDVVLGLGGSSYVAGSATFVVLMIATVPIALNSVMSQAALSLDAIRAWLLSDLALAVTVVGVAWILVPEHESLGLALGYALAYGVTCVVLAVPLRRHVRVLSGTPPEGAA